MAPFPRGVGLGEVAAACEPACDRPHARSEEARTAPDWHIAQLKSVCVRARVSDVLSSTWPKTLWGLPALLGSRLPTEGGATSGGTAHTDNTSELKPAHTTATPNMSGPPAWGPVVWAVV